MEYKARFHLLIDFFLHYPVISLLYQGIMWREKGGNKDLGEYFELLSLNCVREKIWEMAMARSHYLIVKMRQNIIIRATQNIFLYGSDYESNKIIFYFSKFTYKWGQLQLEYFVLKGRFSHIRLLFEFFFPKMTENSSFFKHF